MKQTLTVIAIIYAAMSIVTFAAFAIDKWKAVAGRRRLRESTLHLLEALGGWPGAIVAMRLVHHKTKDASYRPMHFLIIGVHVALWLIFGFLAMR